ncbi:MAG: Uncharacterized protein XD81_0140 [Bacteroidetes bacterium 38_7]|nr:MAG: Uncharacterized protein XD81_0140 [Bacteroidetes bacterium 38_7]HAL65993.1 hypothetical protein [Bacteroidales bacterium]
MKRLLISCFSLGLLIILFLSSCVDEVKDDTEPFITIVGSNPAYIRLNSAFRDSGIIVTDNYGVFKMWIDTSELNTREAGRYKVYYFAEDFNNNVAKAERTVIVRIEGSNLTGEWQGERISPYPSGLVVPFVDSLYDPGIRHIYFKQIGGLYPSIIKADLLGSLGDTLAIRKQIVSITDTSTTYFSASGTIAHNGKSFQLFYHLITETTTSLDTSATSQLIYHK